jgi:hypothetical protein
MKFFPLSLLLAYSVLCSMVSAEPLNDLYKVVVPVASQSSADLRTASGAGLATVFIRMSGRADTLQSPLIKQAMGNAQSYLQQYSYTRVRDPNDGSEQLNLVLDFEPGQVDAQLRAAGLPMWSANRPSILLWLAFDEGAGRQVVGVQSSPQTVAAIEVHAKRRGLPIHLPLLDLEDNIAVSAQALWSLDLAKAEQASSRYQPDSLLIGKASLLSTGKWLGAWRFSFDGRTVDFETEAADLDAFVGQAIDRVAEQLSGTYAILPVSIARDGILVRLGGIETFTDYARAIRYLEGLAAIRSASVVAIDGNEIILRLAADGQLQQLQQVISRDGLLLPGAARVTAAGQRDEVLLNYQWPDALNNSDSAEISGDR